MKHVRATNVTGELTPSPLRDPKIFRTERSKTTYASNLKCYVLGTSTDTGIIFKPKQHYLSRYKPVSWKNSWPVEEEMLLPPHANLYQPMYLRLIVSL